MNWLRVNGEKFGISKGILMNVFYVRCATKIGEWVTKI
jgi:hypothetical protein